MQFEGTVEKFEAGTWSYHIPVPPEIALSLLKNPDGRRIICSIDHFEPFHCALQHDGLGGHVIYLNKQLVTKYNFKLKQRVGVLLKHDSSKYGMEVPVEFEELLRQDAEGSRLFHELTPGMQRSLIHFVARVKSSDILLRRSMVVLEHLKKHSKVDGELLMEEMKEANRNWK